MTVRCWPQNYDIHPRAIFAPPTYRARVKRWWKLELTFSKGGFEIHHVDFNKGGRLIPLMQVLW